MNCSMAARDFVVDEGLHVNETVSGLSEPVEKVFKLMKGVVCCVEGLSDHDERELNVNLLSLISRTSTTKPQPPHTYLDHKTNSGRVDAKKSRPRGLSYSQSLRVARSRASRGARRKRV
jgi:hypothetical protein